MATRPVVNDVDFQGLSTDVKPSGPNGSTYHIIDTGEVLVCHEGIWSQDLRLIKALQQAGIF